MELAKLEKVIEIKKEELLYLVSDYGIQHEKSIGIESRTRQINQLLYVF